MFFMVIWFVGAVLLIRIYFDRERGLKDEMFFKALLWPIFLVLYVVNSFAKKKEDHNGSDSESK